jgi:molybdate transport system substrate-binding protein
MHRRHLLALLLILLSATAGLAAASGMFGRQGRTELTVFAAASLTDAYRELGRNFEAANPGVSIVFNFAGSQQLAAQLGQAAPADVFASADRAQMLVAIEAGRVDGERVRIFAQNQLVVIRSPASKVAISQLQDLAQPGLRLILAARTVPVGRYSLDFLEKAAQDPTFGSGYRDAVLGNVVSYEENVRAVLTKVALGEGDAGIVYLSDLVSSPSAPLERIDIPTGLNVIASYPIAPVSDAKHAALAEKFVDYMLAEEGQRILARYGFTLP